MVFLTGPRQVGKTYLAKQIMRGFKRPVYLNWDDIDDAQVIRKRQWSIRADLVVLDEVHKMKNWKLFLKGTFDTKPEDQALLVTGSARLETFRQTGESLAGRYFHYRLHPLSVKEVEPEDDMRGLVLDNLLARGGFPEPYLAGDPRDINRWRNQYYTDLVREDILDFSRIHEVKAIRTLVEMLRSRVGSLLSCRSLAEDLQVAPNTVRKYVEILQSLYIIFLIRPFHKNIARALTREPKLYFYDTGFVKGDDGIKFENLTAVSLLKHVQFCADALGKEGALHYLRTKEGKEIDFILVDNDRISRAVEVKDKETSLSKNIKYFRGKYRNIPFVQIVRNMRQARQVDGVPIEPAADWLAGLEA